MSPKKIDLQKMGNFEYKIQLKNINHGTTQTPSTQFSAKTREG